MLALFVFTIVGTGQSVCSPVDRSGSASDVPRAASTRKGSWRWGNRVSERDQGLSVGGQVTPSGVSVIMDAKCQMQRSVVIIVSALRAVMVLAWNILEEPRSGCGSVDGRGRGRGRWWWWVMSGSSKKDGRDWQMVAMMSRVGKSTVRLA